MRFENKQPATYAWEWFAKTSSRWNLGLSSDPRPAAIRWAPSLIIAQLLCTGCCCDRIMFVGMAFTQHVLAVDRKSEHWEVDQRVSDLI